MKTTWSNNNKWADDPNFSISTGTTKVEVKEKLPLIKKFKNELPMDNVRLNDVIKSDKRIIKPKDKMPRFKSISEIPNDTDCATYKSCDTCMTTISILNSMSSTRWST